MAEAGQFEAGVFDLTPEGWMLLKRRTFPTQDAALQRMRRSTNALAAKQPSRKLRGSVVSGWLTLDTVLADYEEKRQAGDLDFSEDDTTQFMVGGEVKAAYTHRQGQFLAFIHYYTKLHGQPPAEGDMERYFKISPSAVHQMVQTLEKRGLIQRSPGTARSIRVLLAREQLPDLA